MLAASAPIVIMRLIAFLLVRRALPLDATGAGCSIAPQVIMQPGKAQAAPPWS
jgi:hypothetical protein